MTTATTGAFTVVKTGFFITPAWKNLLLQTTVRHRQFFVFVVVFCFVSHSNKYIYIKIF